jgi:hypothetical protein
VQKSQNVEFLSADDGNRNEGCTGAELQLYWPGFSYLEQVGWNDRAKSFNCAAV